MVTLRLESVQRSSTLGLAISPPHSLPSETPFSALLFFLAEEEEEDEEEEEEEDDENEDTRERGFC